MSLHTEPGRSREAMGSRGPLKGGGWGWWGLLRQRWGGHLFSARHLQSLKVGICLESGDLTSASFQFINRHDAGWQVSAQNTC